jgi:hypothetical protein
VGVWLPDGRRCCRSRLLEGDTDDLAILDLIVGNGFKRAIGTFGYPLMVDNEPVKDNPLDDECTDVLIANVLIAEASPVSGAELVFA